MLKTILSRTLYSQLTSIKTDIIIGTWPRTSVRNQLHALAMGQWICRKRKMWTAAGRQELEGLALGPWASRLRRELLEIED